MTSTRPPGLRRELGLRALITVFVLLCSTRLSAQTGVATPAAKKGAEAGAETGAETATEEIVIGSIGLVDSLWGHTVYRGFRDGAAEAGVSHRPRCHDFDLAREKQLIEELIEAQVDAIVMVPMREEASVFMVRQALAAGIPVLCVGICLNSRDNERYISAFFESDNYEVGYLGGAYLGQWLVSHGELVSHDPLEQTAEGGSGPIQKAVRIGIVHSGIYGVSDRRRRGFSQALADAGVAWTVAAEGLGAQEEAARRTTRDIVARGDIDIIWADNSENTVYALAELERLYDETGRRIYLFGIELDVKTAAGLRDRRAILQAVSSQSTYELARRAVLEAVEIARTGLPRRSRHRILQADIYSRDFPIDLDTFDVDRREQEAGDALDPPQDCWRLQREEGPP